MVATISSTFNPQYIYFVPITTWCFNKLGIDVICFLSKIKTAQDERIVDLIFNTREDKRLSLNMLSVNCNENQEATYIQCSRIYGAAINNIDEGEYLVTGDVDMLIFEMPPKVQDRILVWGSDLTPPNQYPICYLVGTVAKWREVMGINSRTYQECLDNLLGHIDCQDMRGNYWAKDQEEAYNRISQHDPYLIKRARQGTQFASRRIDRDDSFWEERISPDIVDAHLWRPGYTDENFPKILHLLTSMYPMENFDWLISYTEKFKKTI